METSGEMHPMGMVVGHGKPKDRDQWNPDKPADRFYIDDADSFDARCGNFLRLMLAIYDPRKHLHGEAGGPEGVQWFRQSSVLGADISDQALKLLKEMGQVPD